MIDVYKKIFKEILFEGSSEKSIAIIPEQANTTSEQKEKDIFNIPEGLLPENVEIFRLSDSISYIDEMAQIFEEQEPKRVFIVPSLLNDKNISKELKNKFVGKNISDWILNSAIELL